MPCTRDQLTWILTWIVSGCIMKIPIWNWGLLNLNWKIKGQKFLMFMIWWARKKWIASKLVSNIWESHQWVTRESLASHWEVPCESSSSLSWVTHKSPISHLWVSCMSLRSPFWLWVIQESPGSLPLVNHDHP